LTTYMSIESCLPRNESAADMTNGLSALIQSIQTHFRSVPLPKELDGSRCSRPLCSSQSTGGTPPLPVFRSR
jgi:hypothetical protein